MDPHSETYLHQSWVFGVPLGLPANNGKNKFAQCEQNQITHYHKIFPAAVLGGGPLGSGTGVPPAILQAFTNAWFPCQHSACPQHVFLQYHKDSNDLMAEGASPNQCHHHCIPAKEVGHK